MRGGPDRKQPRSHPWQRGEADAEPALADLFETLEPDRHPELLGGVAGSFVQDRFGHSYKVVNHGACRRRGRQVLWCVEVAAGETKEA